MKILKKFRSVSFFLVLLALVSCDREDFGANDTFQFEVESFVTIPAGLSYGIGLKHTFRIQNIPTNIETILEGNGVNPDEVEGIYPRRAILSTNFQEEDLNFLRIVELDLFDDENRKEGYYHPEVARNPGNEVILFENNQVNMKEFMLQQNFNFELRTQHEEVTRTTNKVRVRMLFGVQKI